MLKKLQSIIQAKHLKIRFNWFCGSGFEISEWGSSLNFPVEGYIEPEHIGPIKMNQWLWLEIDPIEIVVVGKLVPDKKIDHQTEVVRFLEENQIAFMKNNEFIRIDNTFFIAET